MSNHDSDLPPAGRFAQVKITGSLESWPQARGKLPPGCFLERSGVLCVSHGAEAPPSLLRFESSGDAKAFAVALLVLAEAMEAAEAEAAARADDALGRVLAEREAAGNG